MSLQQRYFSILFALSLLNTQTSFAQSNVTELIKCSAFDNCRECTNNLACGFCVTSGKCVQGSWNEPFKNPETCTKDNWEYEYAQCFVTHKQALISLISAFVGILFISILLCFCCCICRCCRIRSHPDDERTPLIGDTVATQHFRRASYYNYNRSRPFERRGRTLSSGTLNNAMQYGRNWRNSTDEYIYGYGAPNTTPSLVWVNDHSGVPTDYAMGSHNNSLGNGEWRRWEKKREELLAKYAKNSENPAES